MKTITENKNLIGFGAKDLVQEGHCGIPVFKVTQVAQNIPPEISSLCNAVTTDSNKSKKWNKEYCGIPVFR